ncbi:hypothetical protein A8B75_11635 [Sphingomonadales bacterium EhC05]|nr:hypothetical protein A8B75_11635 [Sphingomonadales bacterium EhC05]
MMRLFISRTQTENDNFELSELMSKHGDNVKALLQARANDKSLPKRSRKHWKRLAILMKDIA